LVFEKKRRFVRRKLAKIGENRRKLAKIGENRQKSAKIGENRRKSAKIGVNRRKSPKILIITSTPGEMIRKNNAYEC
jgi:hypothetical protein